MIKVFKQLLLALGLALFLLPAQADMVATGEWNAPATSFTDSLQLRQQMHQQLVENGVELETAGLRIAAMTDTQLLELKGNLASLPAGAGISTNDLLLIVILLLLL